MLAREDTEQFARSIFSVVISRCKSHTLAENCKAKIHLNAQAFFSALSFPESSPLRATNIQTSSHALLCVCLAISALCSLLSLSVCVCVCSESVSDCKHQLQELKAFHLMVFGGVPELKEYLLKDDETKALLLRLQQTVSTSFGGAELLDNDTPLGGQGGAPPAATELSRLLAALNSA